jgi:uncharacterized SAM-binding protein YcdF (DUF218 family)
MTDPGTFFAASKIGWYIVAPSHLLIWSLVAAAILLARGRRAGKILTVLCAALFLLILGFPVGNLALRPLEDQYARPPWPERVDGILVLGEGLNGKIYESRGVPGIGPASDSLVALRILAERYPEARIVFSGGSGELSGSRVPEARIAEDILRGMGLPASRISIETASRNTWENIDLSRAIARPAPGETWLLLVSAFHMPRAMAVARSLDWPLVPWPSNYLTTGTLAQPPVSLGTNLAHLDLAAHEWLGLLVYRLDHKAL